MSNKRPGSAFQLNCVRCPRLASHLEDLRQEYPQYHNKPVAPFGPVGSPLLIVGLAPGLHGANATGRPFTGDHAGIILYETLHRHGFCNQALSEHRKDGLKLTDCRITNAVKCLPPANKPIGSEVNTCNDFLVRDIAQLPQPGIILALGGVAHRAVLKALGLKQSAAKFGHGTEYEMAAGITLVSSYHCSRYNTQTKRLTQDMFDQIFQRLAELVKQAKQ